jgi:hypothetical protein
MQKWMPAPKERLGASWRSGLKTSENQADFVAALEGDAIHLDVLERPALEDVDRRANSQRLLHRSLRRGLVAKHLCSGKTTFQDGAHGIADLVNGRLMAGIEEHDGGGNQFVVAQILALVFRMDHVAEQIFARCLLRSVIRVLT